MSPRNWLLRASRALVGKSALHQRRSSHWNVLDRQFTFRLTFEELEGRAVPATFTVTNTNDSGAGSLRQAIADSNSDAGSNTIDFNIPGSGVQTITLDSALPSVTDSVVIDGYSQPGASANTSAVGDNATILIQIDGTNAGASASGFTLTSSGSTIRGLAIGSFGGNGVLLNGGATGNTIAGDFIGTNAAGTAAVANGTGVELDASASTNTIGGTTAGARNVISGNTGDGIDITGGGSTGNVVEGNYIGLDATGTTAVGNTGSGVELSGSTSANTIGGTAAGARNVISGNLYSSNTAGVLSSGSHNTIEGNYIGTDATGEVAVGEQYVGVWLNGDAFDTVGGTTAGAGNVVSGGNTDGLRVDASNNFIEGNSIGLDASGTKGLGNLFIGVFGVNGSNNTIGGAATGDGNTISGNGEVGVAVEVNATGYTIQGNLIGTDPTGTVAIPNQSGILIETGSNLVGGLIPAARNVISGNTQDGVGIEGTSATQNVVEGNYIGTDVTGAKALENGSSGNYVYNHAGLFVMLGASDNTIGGTAAGALNVISGNNGDGIEITGAGTSGNTVEGDYIGTDAAGTAALPDTTGVEIDTGAGGNTVGGTTAAARNVISGNSDTGVDLNLSGDTANAVEGNYIGTDFTGTLAVPNAYGVVQSSYSFNTIGGPTPTPGTGAGNVISGNSVYGIFQVSDDLIEGNLIGTTASGTAALGNGYATPLNAGGGIYIQAGDTATNDTIGGSAAVDGNVISGNIGAGIGIEGGDGNVIEGNYIGLDITGTTALGNSAGGVGIAYSNANVIGGSTAGAGNVISCNAAGFNAAQVTVGNGDQPPSFSTTTDNLVEGNDIGTDHTGLALPVGATAEPSTVGVLIQGGAADNAVSGNVIGGCTIDGVVLMSQASDTSGNQVSGNFIGVGADGSSAVPNAVGVLIDSTLTTAGAVDNIIGGTTAAARNVISGNAQQGVLLEGSGTSGNTVEGNSIGTNAAGTAAVADGSGVLIETGASDNTIGAVTTGAGNTIAFDGGFGVAVTGTGTGNAVRGNAIYANGGVGIGLGGAGVISNDSAGHVGPNDYQNFPVLSFVGSGSSANPQGTLDAAPNAAYAIDFYASSADDPTGYGPGQRYLGSTTVVTDATGHGTFSAVVPGGAAPTDWISATATDSAGNTSEFSQSILADVPPSVALTTPTDAVVGVTLPFTPVVIDSVSGKSYQYAWTVTCNGAAVALPDATYVATTPADEETFFFDPQRVGTFTVSVTVTDSRGGVTVSTSPPIVVGGAVLGITITGDPLGTPAPFGLTAGQPVTLDSEIADPRATDPSGRPNADFNPHYTYTWSVTKDGVPYTLPAGTVTNAAALTFTPAATGLYRVSLATIDGTTAAGSDGVSLDTTAAPAAQIIVNPGTSVAAGTEVQLQAVVTDLALTKSLTYHWTITPDNGQAVVTETDTTGVFSFEASAVGGYTVALTVVDDQNRSGVSTPVLVRAARVVPTVAISGAPYSVRAGGTVSLTGAATDADPNQPGSGSSNTYTLSWSAFATAGTLTASSPTPSTYTFTDSAAGLVDVTLTATDQTGFKTSTTALIRVTPPAGTLTVTPPATPTQAQPLTWSAAVLPGPGGVVTYSWTVSGPDGVTRTYDTGAGNTFTTPYGALPGRYDLTVTAVTGAGTFTTNPGDPGTFVVVPHAPVTVGISASTPPAPRTNYQEGDAITLTGSATEPGVNLSDPSQASYLWTVTGPSGFSQVGVLPTLTFQPLAAGTYTATLTVRDYTGGSGTSSLALTVLHVPPEPILTFVDVGSDGTTGFRATVINASTAFTYTYAVTLNGQPYIPPTPGGAAFTFRVPPVNAKTLVSVSVTDSLGAVGTYTATLETVAAGTAAAPVQSSVTAASLLPSTQIAVVLAQGYDAITADPSLPTTATVQFVAVGGHNTLVGGQGTNIFQGDSGSNSLVGGSGPNTYYASGNDTAVGGSGTNDYVPVAAGTAAGNTLDLSAGAGANTIDLSQQNGVSLNLTTTGAAQSFAAGTAIDLTGAFQAVVGSPGPDTLTAAGGTSISGGGGNDLLTAANVNDVTLSSASGQATLQATGGSNVVLIGGKGTDLLSAAGVANASLVGGSGNNDSLVASGGAANISLVGGSGNNDSLLAGAGTANVSLVGGSGGNDSLIAGTGALNVSLVGGSGGNDSLIAGAGAANVSLVGGSGNNDSLLAGVGSANVSLVGGSGGNDSLIAGAGVTNVSLIGGSGNNDSLLAGAGTTTVSLVGGSGNNDSLIATGAANISLVGGSGNNDSLLAGAGTANVSLVGGSGNNDSLIAGAGALNISLVGGSGGNDSLIAGAGAANISLVGGSGSNDSLIAGAGAANVSLVGGSGNNDSLVTSAGALNVSLIGGSGSNDSLIAGGANVTLIGGSGNNDSLIAGAGVANVSLIGGSGSNDSLVAGVGAANISLVGGSGNNDSLFAGAANVTLVGGSGNNDSLVTGAGLANISLIGGSGNNDSLLAGAGAANVSLIGGSGNNDSLLAGAGAANVSLIGGSGNNDSLVTGIGAANVSLVGGSGSNDSLVAGAGGGNISLVGGSGGNDSLFAGTGNVSLIGGSGNNDSVVAGAGTANISLVGGSGNNDSLFAGAGVANISLVGGSGNNDSLLVSAGGVNVSLVGGSGNNDSLVALGGANVSLIGGSGSGDSLSVTNTAGAVLLGGLGGAVSLTASGASSNVLLIGGFGADSLAAGAGVSSIEIVGGFGNGDSIALSGVTGATAVGGFGNNDSLVASAASGVNIVAGYGSDAYLSQTDGTNVNLYGQSGNNDSLISAAGTNVSLVGGSGGSLFLADTGGTNVSVLGGAGNADTLVSTDGTDVTLFGGNGSNDSLYASGDTNVTLLGGLGSDDTLTAAGLSDATLFGGAGDFDSLSTAGGTGVLAVGGTGYGNSLSDTDGTDDTVVNGGNQLSSLTASGGTAVNLFGGGGSDDLTATGGTDIGLYGENGNNNYDVGGTAADPFSGFLDDLGTVGLEQSSTDQFEAGMNAIAFPTATNISIDLSNELGGSAGAAAAGSATQAVTSGVSLYLVGLFEGVEGTAGSDYIKGDAVPDSLVAGSGNATLVAGSGDTTLVAGAGNDLLVGGAGKDTYSFQGSTFGDDTITQGDAANLDTIDLSQLGAAATLNLASTAPQAVTPHLELTLTDPTESDVIGSPFGNTITGNARDNHVTLSTGDNAITAGTGLTTLNFTGSSLGTNAITAPTQQSVVLNFHALGTPLSIDLSQAAQAVAGGTVAFTGATDSRAVASVVGTTFDDTIVGDSAPGAPAESLYGGGGRDSIVAGSGDDFLQVGVPQVVLLDFDTYTPLSPNNHVYTREERDAIQQRMAGVYADFSSAVTVGGTTYSNGFEFTQSLATAEALTRSTGGQFVTIYFNEPPAGGQAEEVDFDNTDLGGTASIDASLILGAPGQPAPTSENFVAESAGLAEHELGHLVGLRHTDSFGPIGTGAYEVFLDGQQVAGIDPALFYPAYQEPAGVQPALASTDSALAGTSVPAGATAYGYETPLHVMGSPASVGTTRFDTLNDIFFGEREDIQLAFEQSGVKIPSEPAAHASAATAQDLGELPGLVVPNTLAPGSLYYGKTFGVTAEAVVGHIGLDPTTGVSVSDWYSFDGHAGDYTTFEAISNVLLGNAEPIDTILRVYDSAGNLLAYNDDELESKDSLILDFQIPADGKYYVQVDTYSANPAQNTSQGNYVLYVYSFNTAGAIPGGSTVVAGAGNDTLYGGNGDDLFRLAAGSLGSATVIGGNGADVVDQTAAPLEQVTLVYAPQTVSITQELGTPPALTFAADLASQSVAKGGFLEFDAAIAAPGRTLTYSLAPVAGGAFPAGAAIGSSDGVFAWSAGDEGTYEVRLIAQASDGTTAATTVTVTATDVAPVLSALSAQTAPVGTAVDLSGSVTLPVAADTYAYTWTVTRNGATVATSSGRDLVFNPGVSGTYAATLSVTDREDGRSSATATTVTVTEVTPVVNPLPSATISEGASVGLMGSYVYPGAAASVTQTWAVTNAAGATVASGSGADFTFTAPDVGAYAITYTAVTASGASASAAAQVTATGVAPTATPPAAVTVAEGTAAVLAFTNPYSPAPAVTAAGFRYSFALSPAALATTYAAAGAAPSFSFTGGIGTYTVYEEILDENNASSVYATQVVVDAVPVVAAGAGSFTATKETATGALAVATFTDPGSSNPAAYAATIDWGDGSTSTGAIALGGDGKTFTVQGGHTYAEQGSYTVQVSIAHGGLPPVAVTDAATVGAPAVVAAGGLTLSATKAVDTGSLSVATFTDPAGPDALGTYAATIDWGDGTTSAGAITLGSDGKTFTVTGDHTYASTGAKTVAVTLSHQGSPAATVTDTATVVNPALVLQGIGIAATRNSSTGQVAVATFTDPGGPDAAAEYSATINWGDGTSDGGTAVTVALAADGRTFDVLGAHAYSAAGSYTITVTARHGTASTASTVTATAAVSNPAVAPAFTTFSGVAGEALSNEVVTTFTDPSGPDAAADYSATINWGDGTTDGGSAVSITLGGDGKTFSVSGSHTYAAAGAPTVTVTVVHGSSPPATASGTVAVAHQPVTLSVTDPGGTYDGKASPAAATVAGVGGSPGPTLGGVGVTFDYEQLGAGGTVIADLGSAAPVHAGGYAVVASYAGTATYAAATSPPVTFVITPAALTYQIGNDAQTYGTAANLATDLGTTIATGVNGENLTVAYASTGDTTTAHVRSGGYPITGTVSNGTGLASDYAVTLAGGTLTVTPYALTYPIGNDAQTYGSPADFATDLGTAIGTGVNGQDLAIAYTSAGDTTTAHVQAGGYAITGAVSNGTGETSDYNVTFETGTLTVNPFAFAYQIGNDTQIAGTPANLAADLPGTVNTGVNGEYLDIAYASAGDTSAAAAGTYPITGTLSNGSGTTTDYTATLTAGTLTVKAASTNVPTTTTAATSGTDYFGQSLTVTATVKASSGGTAVTTGSVDFFDTTTNVDLGKVALTAGGTATLKTSTLPVGKQTLTLTYLGSGNDQKSTATTTVTIAESVYVLDRYATGALTLSGSAGISVGGLVEVDSKSSAALVAVGAPSIRDGALQVVGGVLKLGSPSLTVTGRGATSDPLSGLPMPSAAATAATVNVGGTTHLTINPGTYTGITVSASAVLTLNPGVYVIEGGGFTVSGAASVSGSGVTIFNVGARYAQKGGDADHGGFTGFDFGHCPDGDDTHGSVSISGGGRVTLTAPTQGTYAGIVFVQPATNPNTIDLSGAAVLGLSGGLIYAPSALLSVTGGAQLAHDPLIVDQLQVSGSASINAAAGQAGAYTPDQIRTAYGVNNLTLDGTGQTVAVVDAYDDPDIDQALDEFDAQFGTTAGGPSLFDRYGAAGSFLTVVGQDGQPGDLPTTDPNGPGVSNWETEEALDVEWIHALAPGARIVLVEADSQSLSDLMAAVGTAADLPTVSVVSMSWGFVEGLDVLARDEAQYDPVLTTPAGHQGVTFVASAGDYGAAVPEYPAFSPNVVAVGGTSLTLNADDSYNSESGWGGYNGAIGAYVGGGGGASRYESEPAYQAGVQSTGYRTAPDVAFDADPGTGVWVADPYNLDPTAPWEVAGGTSLSAPAWAALAALADEGRVAAGAGTLGRAGDPTATQEALYGLPASDFNAVTTGNNGYSAGAGYNLITGLGTPVADRLVPDLIAGTTVTGQYSVTVTAGDLLQFQSGGGGTVEKVFDAVVLSDPMPAPAAARPAPDGPTRGAGGTTDPIPAPLQSAAQPAAHQPLPVQPAAAPSAPGQPAAVKPVTELPSPVGPTAVEPVSDRAAPVPTPSAAARPGAPDTRRAAPAWLAGRAATADEGRPGDSVRTPAPVSDAAAAVAAATAAGGEPEVEAIAGTALPDRAPVGPSRASFAASAELSGDAAAVLLGGFPGAAPATGGEGPEAFPTDADEKSVGWVELLLLGALTGAASVVPVRPEGPTRPAPRSARRA